MRGARRCVPFTVVSTILSFFTASFVLEHFGPALAPPSEKAEERSWIASSQSWLDRKACDWFGLCGLTHLNRANWTWESTAATMRKTQSDPDDDRLDMGWTDPESFWTSGTEDPNSWSDRERQSRNIPSYVMEYAPLVYLYSGEEFWPCDMAEHLIHTTPHLNYTPLQPESLHPNLTNLDDLNAWGRPVYLKSNDNVEERPEWLGGKSNIPSDPDDTGDDDDDDAAVHEDSWGFRLDEPRSQDEWERQPWFNAGAGDTTERGGVRPNEDSTNSYAATESDEGEELVEASPRRLRRHPRDFSANKDPPSKGGRSDAPSVLIVVDKGAGVVDAFWFYFYSYNLGNEVFNVRFGNHVGDWEHSAVRFHNGTPQAVYFSEHNFGRAYSYGAVQKIGKRPVVYSATGTHANYARPGIHPYVLPWGLLTDVTDRGPLWDPAMNTHAFTYDYRNDTLRAATRNPRSPTEWFYFGGHWGDKFYPLSDPRQYRFAGQYHYVNGPLGPRFKNLGRKSICQGNGPCRIKGRQGLVDVPRPWKGLGRGDELGGEAYEET